MTMILGSLQESSILISICILLPPFYGLEYIGFEDLFLLFFDKWSFLEDKWQKIPLNHNS